MRLFNDKDARKISKWQEKEREHTRKQLREETFERNGALVWKASGNVVPMDVFRDAGYLPPKSQKAERDRQVDEHLAEYLERMKNYQPSEEEMFEMRAAFGPGETIVNIITGKVVNT